MTRQAFLLSLPALLLVCLFGVVMFSFAEISLLSMKPGAAVFSGPPSLANYERLLASSGAWRAVATTMRLSFIITVLCIVAGYPLARVLARSPSASLRRFVLFCLVGTFLSGGVTRAYAWLIILGNRGIINRGLEAFGLPTLKLLNNEFAVVVSVLNFVLPFFVMTLFGALKTIPATLEDASRNLGASPMRTFLHVTLPLSIPGLAVSTSLCFAMSLGAFLFPQMLGGGRVQVLATAIYERIQASYNIPEAAALAFLFFILVIVILVVTGLLRRLVGRRFAGDPA
ncbi:ABC transporter permease [Chelatococcus asaccharovorans]|uniref:Putative spermidine/putrescine transport system permease protein n=1 Tax=Chelatococcus asaccharovorans TaxID=28210 RepID=A0A2V3UG70_9HYPH|nr:ABC transporter permease [Chelatococcus asaccharovorans]MBS7703688.1 ABC transporter permease [Chelatococcus asaccharovorans]PXW57846.1 putative spermidine/putrescine transport system permease protein [Chelatococcus asaccharovorans]CAH1668990.1 putative spermidine/putrescine transport system permease protein [Chelatococcus asaccharovorans]CAH1679589.1 putative spermidine/putrescine transport system permease protein [Chelatococcus asaccharovorans]